MPPVLSVPLSARGAVRVAVTVAIVAAPARAAPTADLGAIGTESARGLAAKRRREGTDCADQPDGKCPDGYGTAAERKLQGECAGHPCPEGYVMSQTQCDPDLTREQCQKIHTHTSIAFDTYENLCACYIPGCQCRFRDPHWQCQYIEGAFGIQTFPLMEGVMCKAPTTAPTAAPTSAPTVAPISIPWDLQQEGDVDVDFSSGEDKTATSKYLKGKGREHIHSLTPGTCGDDVPTVAEDVVATTEKVTAHNVTHEHLELVHAFNLSLVSTVSGLYDDVANILRFCQTVGLTHNLSATDYYLIAQLQTQVNVTLNMTSGFDVDVTTEEATVGQSGDNVTLTDVLRAYHCKGAGLEEEDADKKLKPNEELSVCIVSQDNNFEIKSLDTMFVSAGFLDPYTELKIVEGAEAVIDAITTLEEPSAISAVVTTRLPVNVIDYEKEGNTVTIQGSATMKFQGGRRRLAVGGRALQAAAAGEEDATFGVSISLAPADEGAAAGPLSGATALVAGSAAFAAGMVAFLLAW